MLLKWAKPEPALSGEDVGKEPSEASTPAGENHTKAQ